MSIGKFILIDPSECPTREDLAGSIARLHKCAFLLDNYQSKKDPSPKALREVASFLELLYRDNRLKQTLMSEEDEGLALEAIALSKIKKVKDKK